MEVMGSVGVAAALVQRVDSPSSLASAASHTRVLKSSMSRGMSFTRRNRRGWSLGVITMVKDEDEGGRRKDQEEPPKVDWDKAWTNFSTPEKKKKKSFLNIDMERYVSRKPERSDYPLSEEVDPLRKTERSALEFWSSPKFFYVLIGITVLLFFYMVVIIGPPPSSLTIRCWNFDPLFSVIESIVFLRLMFLAHKLSLGWISMARRNFVVPSGARDAGA
ncbi:hypothetical protein R1sor_019762 [Riccia sorocarpa]|uniref:Uncharacterized protein n=1 Tax=Riccia sorocarpa TaxID=122646 RepID=A0ABD3IH26_9MARC